ncbi:MAG: response regulator [Candidatus Binatota bacterium]
MASKKKILVVEDNEDNREIFVFRLQQLDFEVIVASNGKEALEIASRSKPDLIFMDLRMPVMDGWEATRALRQTEWGRDLPVIAVTAHAMKEEREKALNAGCDEFILKPVDYSIIQRTIQRLSR